MMNQVKGFKVFNHDWTCREKQYTCPGKFEENIKVELCKSGMHFCERAVDCFNYYTFSPENKVAEVVAYGDVMKIGDKCCTDKLEIVREISWHELLEIVNMGRGCTGIRNTGDQNSGDRNTGIRNTGDRNTGICNAGYRNTGSYNFGDYNSGYWNFGCTNAGNNNTGSQNAGNWNSGNFNAGDWNKGNFNTGDWNLSNYSNGCFNTNKQTMYMFNQPSNWTYYDWAISEARRIMDGYPALTIDWIPLNFMNEKEEIEHPEAKTTGGYLKVINEYCNPQEWWDSLSAFEQDIVLELPNFNSEIFYEITGIDVNKHSDADVKK